MCAHRGRSCSIKKETLTTQQSKAQVCFRLRGTRRNTGPHAAQGARRLALAASCIYLALALWFFVTSWGWINLLVRAEPGSAAWDQGWSPSLYRVTQPVPPARMTKRGGPRCARCNQKGFWTPEGLKAAVNQWQTKSRDCGWLEMRQLQ